jgi:magnesium transporter
MLSLFRPHHDVQIDQPGPDWRPPSDTVWIDLLNPTEAEEEAVELALGIDIPTREEMAHIEPSSRLYQENGATFMTATLLAHSQDHHPTSVAVTFILAHNLLVTVRYDELKAFNIYAARLNGAGSIQNAELFLGLMDAVVERLAETLEQTSAQVEACAVEIFGPSRARRFEPLLTALARAQSISALARSALVSLGRLCGYAALAPEVTQSLSSPPHLSALQHDIQSLTEQASYKSSHIAFLLDAALGLINIEQNGIIKFFSVVAVIFLPPTLVASIYGMNFDHMPELHWLAGYPMALGMMVASVVLPLLWFRRKGWF